MNNIKLNESQQELVRKISEFLVSDQTTFVLAGVGGSGKTTCLKQALEGSTNVIGATISHSAKFVLSEALNGIANCITIAQLLGLKQSIGEDGEIRFLPKQEDGRNLASPIVNVDILVIDECSMIDDSVYAMIMSMKKPECKVIFVGDPFQLPAIENKEGRNSITFDNIDHELFDSVRYTGYITELGNAIRGVIQELDNGKGGTKNVINDWMHSLDYDSRTSLVDEDGCGVIFLNDIEKVVDIAVKEFKSSDDTEKIRLIAYRNASIKKINDVIRSHIYDDESLWVELEDKNGRVMLDEDGNPETFLPEFVKGEIIICDGGYSVKDNNNRRHSVIYNNQTFRVKGFTEVDNGPSGVPCLAMNLSPHVSLPIGSEIYCMNFEKGRYMYWDKVNELKKNAKESKGKQWPLYYQYVDQFAQFSYAYAISSHKAQGRTFENVIVFENDIFSVRHSGLKEKLQSLYVACTRARKRVYVYNQKFRVDQSKLPDSIKEELGL